MWRWWLHPVGSGPVTKSDALYCAVCFLLPVRACCLSGPAASATSPLTQISESDGEPPVTSSELATVPRISSPSTLTAWVHQTARSDDPTQLTSWAATVDRMAGPGTPEAEPPRIADLVARAPWADPALPLTHDIAQPVTHDSWEFAAPAPGPGGSSAGQPPWQTAGIPAAFAALVVRADRTRSELRARAREANRAGLRELATALDAHADRWAQLASDALGYAAGWELAPLRRWWDAQQEHKQPRTTTPTTRKASRWV